jgi:hypothetical protein
MFHLLAILLVINMALFHASTIADGWYWLLRKLFKPKFKVGDIVVVGKDLCEVIHISSRGMPYSYFCLPLNRFNSILGNYYPQKQIKALPDLTKSLL